MCQPKQIPKKTPEGNKYNRRTDVRYIPATIALFLSAMIVSTFWHHRQCDQSKTDLKIDFSNELAYKLRFAKKAHRLYHEHILDLTTADYEKQLDELWKSCNATDNELKAKLEAVEKESAKTGKQEDDLVIQSINRIMGLDRKLIATDSNNAILLQICFYQQFALLVLTCCWFYTWNDMQVQLTKREHYFKKVCQKNHDMTSRMMSIQCPEAVVLTLDEYKKLVTKSDNLSKLDDEKVVTETDN